jgi:hypothetical protein
LSERRWQPLQRAVFDPPPATLDAASKNPRIAALVADSAEVWQNNLYVVIVKRGEDGEVSCLSIRRGDRKTIRDWRHLQQIKNELAGPETEAVELFPATSRLVDVANQTWLWVMPPGTILPLGFPDRFVFGPHEDTGLPDMGSQQRTFQEGLTL